MPRPKDNVSRIGPDDFVSAFQAYLGREGLKNTRQRELIARLFCEVEGHVSVEELLQSVRSADSAVGYATVYRTLKLLADAGLASIRQFGEGFRRFEPRGQDHHDHLICETCGFIVEFHDEIIERRQEDIAQAHGFRLARHRMDLFGHCARCRGALEDAGEDASPIGSRRGGGADELPEAFHGYLARAGLKNTRQRDLIAELFSGVTDHVSVEDLLARVKAIDPSIGYATVYRTMKLLVEAGLASCRHFGDGYTRFEPRSESHHDHLICEATGQIIEFQDAVIERRQEEIAAEHGFVLARHRHDLYGVSQRARTESD